MRKRPPLPSPGFVIACLALAVALSGSAYAVTALPRNSVGTAQLKANAVNSEKVKNGSLRRADFAAGQIPAGPKGAQGEQGAQGIQGPAGVPDSTVVSSTFSVAAGSFASTAVTCPQAQPNVLGGGHEVPDSVGNLADVMQSRPLLAENGWVVRVRSGAANAFNVTAYAVCG